ncbi:MAG TPA: amidohydrolase family protein [Opitutaceae bacterium]
MPLEYTDSHVHFWDTSLRSYPWLAEVPTIAAAHGPGELAIEAAGELPSRVVFVQADCERTAATGEVEWVESLSSRIPRTAGIVAFAPMDAGGATTAALQALARRPLVKGVRHLIQGETDPGFCLSAPFIEGVRECGRLGLSFDICVRHPQLATVTELVARCPGTSFILDHAGKPDLRASLLDSWRSNIRELSRLPNVVCKVSGLVTEAGTAARELERFVPVIGQLLESFGPQRLLFGSDWPVVKLAAPYPVWLGMAKKLLAHLSGSEQALIFNANAARVYRLG